MKITIIGAGSAEFSTEIVRDVLATPALESGTFGMVDIHAGRLELAQQASEKLIAESGRSWTVEASLDRREVLAGTDYVIKLAGQVNLRDWAASEPEAAFLFENDTMTRHAWTGPSKKFGKASLFMMEWINPHPDKTITSIDAASEGRSILVLVGLSVGSSKPSGATVQQSSPEQIAQAVAFTQEAKALLTKAEKSQKAVALLEKAIATAPDQPEASLNLGYISEDAKDWDKAIGIYEDLIRHAPEHLEAYQRLGQCFEKKGDYENAIKAYRASLKVNVNQPPILEALAAAKKKHGK